MSDEPERADWSTYDVSWLTGASYRQLDYWIRTARPSEPLARHARTGSGSRRRFTDDDVRLVDLIVRLIGAGVARELARHLASSIPTGEPINRQLVPGVFLIVEWRSVDDIEAEAGELRPWREPVRLGGRHYRR